jgi:hypothetical protein
MATNTFNADVCLTAAYAARWPARTTNDPLKLAYFTTPLPIADWVAHIPMIDIGALEQLRADQILDDELIAAAQESIKRDNDDPSTMTIPSNS